MLRRNFPTFRRLSLLLLTILSSLTFTTQLRAQAIPVITGDPQLFIQRGQSLDVTISGQRLDSIDSIALPHSRGLQVTLEEPDKNVKPVTGAARLHLVADADAALGERELRLIGPAGASGPLRVTVGQYPLVSEKEPNNSDEEAQDISFPITLAGKMDVAGDIDCFRFSAKKGEKLVFNVHAVRARSPLDPILLIHDMAGRELPISTEHNSGDPIVIFEAPADGRYILNIRDLQYGGGSDYTYRIDAGPIPYIQSVLPLSVQPGKIAEVKPAGVNLGGADTIPLDLTFAGEGEISIRAHASAGVSNAVKVDVNELPKFVDQIPGRTAALAVPVPFPIDISGRIDQPGQESYFKFHVSRRQVVTLHTIGRRLGSPLNALLTLRNAKAATMQSADDAAGPDASITRELDAGDYLVSVSDLFFNGGPSYAYRLLIRAGAGVGTSGEADFSARFLPDTPRLSRSGNTILFVDLQRRGDFKGDITVTLEDLPPGVTCPPLIVNDKLPGASGLLVLSATPDATRGSFPIRLRATASIGSTFVSREGTPMLSGRSVESAYLTVLDGAPFALETAATFAPPRLTQLAAEADALAAKLAAATPGLEAAEAAWEKKVLPLPKWTALDDATISTASGTEFSTLPDGSFLAGNPSPERDTYTVVAATDLKMLTGIRLEAIPDPSLPSKGPGRNAAGNFVLSQFTVTAAPLGDPANAKPVVLRDPHADIEQVGFGVIDAIEPKPGRGWAMFPHAGTPNQAVFFAAQPLKSDRGFLLTFTLDHQFGQQHTLGRFRISVTDKSGALISTPIPETIARLLEEPAESRSPESKARNRGLLQDNRSAGCRGFGPLGGDPLDDRRSF